MSRSRSGVLLESRVVFEGRWAGHEHYQERLVAGHWPGVLPAPISRISIYRA